MSDRCSLITTAENSLNGNLPNAISSVQTATVSERETGGKAPAELPPFVAFPKIPRWRRDVICSEKIDGTNAQVYIPEDPNLPIMAGSRNRWVTPERDNYGWAAWVAAHAEELRALGPGHHYGEWFGVGIQRGYGLFERRFALFNTSRWNENRPPPACCTTVPVLTIGPNNEGTIESCLERLRTEGSVMVPGFMRPEGIVVFHGASGRSFKILLEGDEHPKGEVA